MHSNSVTPKRTPNRKPQAFTLIEMIGVLAVIAILAALLIPKVFNAINDSRINGTTVSLNTIKTAVVDHAGKYGQFNSVGGTNALPISPPLVGYDTNVLMVEGLIDKPFAPRIGTDATVRAVPGGQGTDTANGGLDYNLDGNTPSGSTTTNAIVVEAVIYGVSMQDAKDLNDRLDGPALGAPDLFTADSKGRVEYTGPVSGTTTVYVYLPHR